MRRSTGASTCVAILVVLVACTSGPPAGTRSTAPGTSAAVASAEPAGTGGADESPAPPSDSTGEDAFTGDPCALLTDAEAADALGQPIGAAEASQTEERATCLWPVTSADSFDSVSVTVFRRAADCDALVASAGATGIETIDGLGECAFVVAGSVTAVSDDVMFSVVLIRGTEEPPEDEVIELARKVAGRL